MAFMETSAKTGMNVDLAFMAVARYVNFLNRKYLWSTHVGKLISD